jgi:cyclopropane fatty-acyl-phospholipid synthase-like methyltransferase
MNITESVPEFDFEGVFGESYLSAVAERLNAQAGAEVDLIWQLLGLEPGVSVLDLACGHGRHANLLAQRGCVVTGLDVTPLFIEEARTAAAELGVAVEYLLGDMRELPWRGRFDRVMNWFSAFGYFSDEECRGILRQTVAALRPGGRLAIDMNNYTSLVADFKDSEISKSGDTEFTAHRRIDPLTGRVVTTQLITENGQERIVPYFIR